jgi:hypothetical protein
MFRQYEGNTYFAKWHYRDVFDGFNDTDCGGYVLKELVNFQWKFDYCMPSDTDKRNGVEWGGRIEIRWDDTRSFVINASSNCYHKAGRSEYKGNYNAIASFRFEKRKGESVKILERTYVDYGQPFFGTSKAPSLQEIERARSLPLNKDLPSWL